MSCSASTVQVFIEVSSCLGSETTLPIYIFSSIRRGVTPEINAVCTLLIAVVAVGIIIASIANKRREAQRIIDEQAALRG